MAETQTIVPHSEGHVSALGEPTYVTGVIFQVEQNEPNKYKIHQVQEQDHFRLAPIPSGAREIDFDIAGIIRIKGWIDTSNLTIDVGFYAFGIKVGEIVGDVRKGIEIVTDGLLFRGSIKIFTKSGKDVWVRLSLTVAGNKLEGEWPIYPLKSHGVD